MRIRYVLLIFSLTILTSCSVKQDKNNPVPTKYPESKPLISPKQATSDKKIRNEFKELNLEVTYPETVTISKDDRYEPKQTIYHLNLDRYTLTITKNAVFTGGGTGLLLDGNSQETDQEPISINGIEYVKQSIYATDSQAAGLMANQVENPDRIYGGTVFLSRKSKDVLTPGIDFGQKMLYNLTYNSKMVTKSNETIIEIKFYPDPESTAHKAAIKNLDEMVKSIKPLN